MFIEQKKSGLYLGKKISGKNFLVKIYNKKITTENLIQLTKKEVDYLQSTKGYETFLEERYNKVMFKKVVFDSKLFFNYVSVSDIFNNISQLSKFQIDFEEGICEKAFAAEAWLNSIFPKEFIYNSNHIEGSRIPKEEVEKIIEERKYVHKVKNEIQEVKNSLKAWDFLQNNLIFNTANIKKLYHVLTKDLLQETGEKYPRGFKKVPNIAGINSITTSPEKVDEEMKNLIERYRKDRKEIFSLQLAFDFHLKYEQIHPFENGNGRTGRLLMNKILMQNGMLPMIVFTENKKSYSSAIASSSEGRKKKYYKFMLEQYKKTLQECYGKIDIYQKDQT